MNFPSHCPHCGVLLDDGDIFEYFLKEYGDTEKALEEAAEYGWEKDKPCQFSRIVGMYDWDTDRIGGYFCSDCGKRIEIGKEV
jgi:hypothetical protein